jgi:hypothetical protein
MKRMLLGFLSLAVVSIFSSANAARSTRVDVLYMNHGPLMDTLDKMRGVFSAYGDRINVSWYDFESREGEDFKAKMGINQHVPLIIWIDGNDVVKVGQRQVKFFGFPTGAGPAFFQGKWTIDDLRMALGQATSGK